MTQGGSALDDPAVVAGAELLRKLLGDMLGSDLELRQMAWGVLEAAKAPVRSERDGRPITRDDRVEAIAARLAYWWRMSFSDDYSQPECEAPYWETAAKMAARAYEEGR